jgi:hypothetical protein
MAGDVPTDPIGPWPPCPRCGSTHNGCRADWVDCPRLTMSERRERRLAMADRMREPPRFERRFATSTASVRARSGRSTP